MLGLLISQTQVSTYHRRSILPTHSQALAETHEDHQGWGSSPYGGISWQAADEHCTRNREEAGRQKAGKRNWDSPWIACSLANLQQYIILRCNMIA